MRTGNKGKIFRNKTIHLLNALSDEKIIYVYAAAGCGKTDAVRQWLDGVAFSKAILSIDEFDNSPGHFCGRFFAALCACHPKSAALAEILSKPGPDDAPDELVLRAIATLTGRKRSVMVVDDLHLLNNERSLSLLLIFLKRLPETFQIILISRNDLPPGFTELWLKGRLALVTAHQLRLSGEEIRLLYKKHDISVTAEQAEDICRLTDGWPIAVNALLLSGGEPREERIVDMLEEFIRSNIWEKWDEATRGFLLSTAAARELSPSLCAALSGVSDSEKLLDKLASSGPFVYQTQSGAYRYHRLFHGFLKKLLKERGDGYLHPLLEKEGLWHLSRQDVYSAAERFAQCGDLEGIVKCAAAAVLYCILDALGDAEQAERTLQRLTPSLEPDTALRLSGSMAALTVRSKLANGDVKAARDWLAGRGEAPPEEPSFCELFRIFTTCRAYITDGRYDEAIIILSRLLRLVHACARPLDIIEAQILLSIAYWKKKRGFQETAARYLSAAVETAYGFKYTQLFVNDGAELCGMMKRLQRRAEQRPESASVPASFVKMLYLKALGSQNTGLTGKQPLTSVKYTEKQKTVMKALAEGKSNKEIADAMGIKITSLRSHIELIYKKLDVTCEADAVVKIGTLGIFNDP